MKYTLNIKAVAAVAMMLFASSCNDSVEREASPVVGEDNMGLYFPEYNTYVSVPVEGGDFDFEISRNEKHTEATTVNLYAEIPEDIKDFITIPTEVSFAANEATATITISVNDEIPIFEKFDVSFSFDSDKINPYLDQSSNWDVTFERNDYAPKYNGTMSSEFMAETDDDGNILELAEWEQTIKYSEILKQYMLVAPYDGAYDIYFTISDKNLIVIKPSTAYVHGAYGPVTIATLTGDDAADSCYDPEAGTLTFITSWDVSLGSFGVYAEIFTIEETLE